MTDNLFFIDEDEVLAHHGVKGMKWGVRKQRAASGGAGSTKKRKGVSRKQKAAIAGVLGTAAAAGAGYYLHKSGKGTKIAALAKKHGASAKDFAKGKGRNLGAQARKAGNKARKAAEGGVGGVKSAAGMAARSAKSAAGAAKSKVGKKTPGKALSTHVVQPGKGVGYRKLATTGTKVVRPKGAAADKLAKRAALGLGVGIGANAAAAAAGAAINRKAAGGKKGGRSRKRRR